MIIEVSMGPNDDGDGDGDFDDMTMIRELADMPS